jgi:hypothetical protein
MPYRMIISEDARLNALEAYNYYEKESPGLGNRFLEYLAKAYDEIEECPTCFGYIDNDPGKIFRDIHLQFFPYLVTYEIIESEKLIIVYSVFNTYQHPSKKLGKR